MIAGSIRRQEPVRYLSLALGAVALLAIGAAGGAVAAVATSQSSSVSTSQTLPAPVTSDHLRPAGPR